MNDFLAFTKDNNAHFTYNMGVSLKRLALIVMAFAVFMGLMVLFQVGNNLEYVSKVNANVISADKHEHTTSRRNRNSHRRSKRTYYTYSVTFGVNFSDGSTDKVTQTISKNMYNKYVIMDDDKKEFNIFQDPYGRYYLSQKEGKDALKEYQSANRTAFLSFARLAFLWGCIGAAALWIMGTNQIRIARKYPRTDGADLIKHDRLMTERAAKEAEFDSKYEQWKAERSRYQRDVKGAAHKPTDVELNKKFK